MGRRLLLGGPGHSWEGTRADSDGADWLSLDPSDASLGCAGRLWGVRGARPFASVFYGSLDPLKAPHRLIAGLQRLLLEAGEDCSLQFFPYQPSPLARQTLDLVLAVAQPDQILVAEGTDVRLERSFETVAHQPTDARKIFLEGQRRAQWLKLRERGAAHEIPLSACRIVGGRIDSGRRILPDEWEGSGVPSVAWAELCGAQLFVVNETDLSEEHVSRVLDHFHASKHFAAHPSDYEHVLCEMVRDSGEGFGFGTVERIDFEAGVMHVHADAIPPAETAALDLGLLRVDANGIELGEHRPWAI